MPRLSPLLLRKTCRIDPLLPHLLRTCRDLQSACNELRWLREHVTTTCNIDNVSSKLRAACLERSRGKPLQYILGNQPFGDLNILCRPGVLIPRPETETYTTHLARTLLENVTTFQDHPNLRILDLCTGTGCIPLLLHSLVSHRTNLSICGIDISTKALALAETNLRLNIRQRGLTSLAAQQIYFEHGNILEKDWLPPLPKPKVFGSNWDIIISNPPYISLASFARDTERSVRNYEPKLALVPPNPGILSKSQFGDTFYPALLKIGQRTKCKILVMEVADRAQALRVTYLAKENKWWDEIEIWCDDMEVWERDMQQSSSLVNDAYDFKEYGKGNARAVVCWKDKGGKWLGRGNAHVEENQ